MKTTKGNDHGDKINTGKVLLALLPFWDPLNPPLGLSCLKSFLQKHGYSVKTCDLNVESQFKEIYDRYFETLAEVIPGHKKSNFFNIGKDVLINHMMAHIHYENKGEYVDLVKTLVFEIFYTDVETDLVLVLSDIISEFYVRLETYFLRLLAEEKPTVLGFSVFKGSLPASLFAAKLTKEHHPHIKTVIGGGIFDDQLAEGSPDLETLLEKAPYIDNMIIGEGEMLFLKFLRGELPPNQGVYSLKDINYEILDLSLVEVPDFSDLDLQSYSEMASYGSRSCPFQCKFCSETIRWGKFRKKTAAQIVEELTKLYRKYGYQLFLMSDSLLNPVITGLSGEFVKADVSIYWDGYLRVDKDTCSPGKAVLWRKGGFYRARFGVESGSQHVLDLMDKRITPDQIKQAVVNLANVGIKTTTYWVIGFPGETEEDFQQTLDLVTELRNYIYQAETNPYWYYLDGQVSSNEWAGKSYLLYPENAKDLLIVEKRELDCEPSREERYRRMARFTEHINKLGVPNPYCWQDIVKADERWQKLQKNAVPPLVEFKEMGKYIDENKYVKKQFFAQDLHQDDGAWGF
jgi:radical SAM superfamily enzyme YgiQ (UPF0313 family)